MTTKQVVVGGLIVGGLALALSPSARKKAKQSVGLSDSFSDDKFINSWRSEIDGVKGIQTVKEKNGRYHYFDPFGVGGWRVVSKKRIKHIPKDETQTETYRNLRKKNGLSDRGKEPAKIKKLREIVKENQYKKISGEVVDVNSARLILQIYDNLPPHIRSGYAKKSIQEMSSIAYKIKGKM